MAERRNVRKNPYLRIKGRAGKCSSVGGFASFFTGGGFSDFGGYGCRLGFGMAVIMLAYVSSSNGGVVYCPCVDSFSPVMASGRDISKGLALRCKCRIGEGCRVGGFAGNFTGSGFGDFGGYGCCFGLGVSCVTFTNMRGGYSGIVCCPRIGGIVPVMPKCRN